MKSTVTLIACLLIGVAFAGCAGTDTNTTTTPTATTTTSPTPTTTTPTTPSPNVGVATGVTVTYSDASASDKALVCWNVAGTGKVQHVAVHYDNVSHNESDVTFASYVGGAAYPDNATQLDPNGYTLPGDWCTNVPVPASGDLYLRAHVIDTSGAPGMLSDEVEVKAEDGQTMTGTVTGVTLAYTAVRATPGGSALACWNVAGTGKIGHVAVHWDTMNHSGDNVTFADYTGGAVYPANATSLASEGYALPGSFCTNVPMPANGTLYYRAHAMDATGAPGMVSAQAMVLGHGQATNVTVTSHPTNQTALTKATVCWSVQGSGNVGHVAVHWDTKSHAGDNATFADYTGGAAYPNNATALAAGGYDLPGNFCTAIDMPTTGTIYLRAHVIDRAGLPGMVSSEVMINSTIL